MMPEIPKEPGPPSESRRAGYVALVGRPNAGKSTLMNALVGDKLSIVTPRAQTTWQRVTGIVTSDSAQMIFLDTPGLLRAKDLLQRSMLGAALEALHEADVVVLVVDAANPPSVRQKAALSDTLTDVQAPILCLVNKIDIAAEHDTKAISNWAGTALTATPFPVSAQTGAGLEAARAAIEAALPEGPFLYPEDDIASQPVRFFVSELIRETAFEQFHQEVPYAMFAQVEEFREEQDPIYIGVNVFVERNSQKGIVVGDKGAAIKRLGQVSRKKIEAFLGSPVYLDLWVKHLHDWRRKRGHLHKLGFKLPDENEQRTSA